MIVAYIPVLHRGYLDFFSSLPNESIGILGSDVVAMSTALVRDCRAVNPGTMLTSLRALLPGRSIAILTKSDLSELVTTPLILPNEDISHELAQIYRWTNVTYANVFLRWNKMPLAKTFPVETNETVSSNEVDRRMLHAAGFEGLRSPDWWRQVGIVLAKDGVVLEQRHNHHLPSHDSLAALGDPRTNFDAGQSIDVTTAIHAEASAIATCAKRGVSLAGADAYVSIFPCPNCARLLAEAGVKRVFYGEGYSLLDAKEVLQAFHVKLIRIVSPDTTHNAD